MPEDTKQKPKLLQVDGEKLPNYIRHLPVPIVKDQVVILLEDVEGDPFIKIKHGKSISRFSRGYFKEVEKVLRKSKES